MFLDKVLFFLFALFIGVIVSAVFLLKEMEVYYSLFITTITVAGFLLSLWSFFRSKD